MPTLVIHGARDPRTEPGELDALRAALGDASARFAILPEGGHSPHSERATADEVTRARRQRFLGRSGSRRASSAGRHDRARVRPRLARVHRRPTAATYRALDDISLAVAAGAFVAIVGPSGCGKSTLLNIAAGPAGAVGRHRPRRTARPLAGLNRRATYMFQQDALLPWKTVRDNVALGLTLAGVVDARTRTRARTRGSTRVGLAAFAQHYPVAVERRHAQARGDGAELDHRSRHRC